MHPRRVECPEHGVHTEAVTWADPRSRQTRAPGDQIAWAMCHLCQSSVRELMRVGASTVAGACRRVPGRVVDRDGAAWAEAACRENLPNAQQVMDPFHVVARVTDALDKVRQQALREAREAYRSLPKGKRGRPAKDDSDAKARAVALAKPKEIEGTRWSLLKSPENLSQAAAGVAPRSYALYSKWSDRLFRRPPACRFPRYAKGPIFVEIVWEPVDTGPSCRGLSLLREIACVSEAMYASEPTSPSAMREASGPQTALRASSA